MNAAGAAAGLPPPDTAAAAHSSDLNQHIRTVIAAAGGQISFSRFMQLALYTPGSGYYSAGAVKLGDAGDFTTAPEISPLFSRCLARQCADLLIDPDDEILELGAGTGLMAADLLLQLDRLDRMPRRYSILETSADLSQRQQQTIGAHAPRLLGRVRWLQQLPAAGFQGVVLGNEVLDALPFDCFLVTAEGPRPLAVTVNDGGLGWGVAPADESLNVWLEELQRKLGWQLPVGYRSERATHLRPWLSTLAERMARGAMIFIDYGYPAHEYYHPERSTGTLICHYRHRAHDDPFLLPGLQDISANVDFSAVAADAMAAGLRVSGYTSQSYFLFGCGLEALAAEIEPADLKRCLAQSAAIKQLTLPGAMGLRFKAIALTKGIDIPLRAFAFYDERQRL